MVVASDSCRNSPDAITGPTALVLAPGLLMQPCASTDTTWPISTWNNGTPRTDRVLNDESWLFLSELRSSNGGFWPKKKKTLYLSMGS